MKKDAEFIYENKGDVEKLSAINLTVQELAAAILRPAQLIYRRIRKQDPAMADYFKGLIQFAVANQHSPVWDTRDANEAGKNATVTETFFVMDKRRGKEGDGGGVNEHDEK